MTEFNKSLETEMQEQEKARRSLEERSNQPAHRPMFDETNREEDDAEKAEEKIERES